MPMSPYMRDVRDRVGHMRLVVPSVSAIIRAPGDRVLLVQQRDDQRWTTPGGAIEPGETPADAAVREAWEETGLLVRPTRILGVHGGPDFVVRYPNGDECQYISTMFECDVQSGVPRPDHDEVHAVAYWSLDEARQLPLASWLPRVLPKLYASSEIAWFDADGWRPPTKLA